MLKNVKNVYVPNFQQKRKVDSHFNPNTYRVLFEEANFWGNREKSAPLTQPDYYTSVHPLPNANYAPRPARDLRHHNPQPWHCSFLKGNVATLNEPVGHVGSYLSKEEQDRWWDHSVPQIKHKTPERKAESTTRIDFLAHDYNQRNTRHSANPNKTPANGAVPVSCLWEKDGSVRVWKEGMSTEQIYNSRKLDNYPPRGRRQGAFVWKQLHGDEAKDAISQLNHPANREEAEKYMAHMEATYVPPDPLYDHPSTRLPREPGKQPYQRQFKREGLKREDGGVARLLQPEFEMPWNKPSLPPIFSD